MKKLLLTVILLSFLLSLPVLAEPFNDVPNNHWSYDAVMMLQEKGLVEGYPDGLFKGDRPTTRYEMAMVVARVIAKLEQLQSSVPQVPDLSIYATKEDLETINKLINEYKSELSALGVRVTNIEDSLNKITARVEELERVFIAGDMTAVANVVGFTKYTPIDPNSPPSDFEGYGGYGLVEGGAFASRLNLDIGVHINEDVTAGGTLVGYSAFGTQGVNYSWGIVPPYNSTGYGSNSIYNNGFNFQTNLNKLWIKTKGDVELEGTIGEYIPETISPLVFYGIVSAAYWAEDRLPVYGINVKGKLFENYKFEVLQANDLTWIDYGPLPIYASFWNAEAFNPFDLFLTSFYQSPGGYHNKMYGATGGYENEKMSFDVTYLRVFEDVASNPSSLFNPKDEIIGGFRGSYNAIDEKLTIFGEYNHSSFDYDLRDNTLEKGGGNSLIIGGRGKYGNINYLGQFIRIDGNYEPFNLRKIYEFKYSDEFHIGEGVLIPSLYRPNRIGFYGGIGYNFDEDKGNVFVNMAYLKQMDGTMSTSPETTVGSYLGFQDHAFLRDSADKGRELFYDFGGTYHITDKWYVEGHYFSFNFNRSYPGYEDTDFTVPAYEHDQTRNYLHLTGTYNVTDNFKVIGIYDMAKTSGIDDNGFNSDNIYHIPGVSFNYNFSEDTVVGIDYRYYNHTDNITIENDYNAHRLTTWMTHKF